MLFITETETRTTTAPYREAGVKDVNTRLEQRAKQRMTHKPPTKLLSPKACVKIGQWNGTTMGVLKEALDKVRVWAIAVTTGIVAAECRKL